MIFLNVCLVGHLFDFGFGRETQQKRESWICSDGRKYTAFDLMEGGMLDTNIELIDSSSFKRPILALLSCR